MDPEFLIVIEPEDCEMYQLPEGFLLIGRNDPFVSMGFIDINSHAQTQKKSRPTQGILKQMAGTSIIVISDGSQEKEQTLHTGDTLQIPAKKEYQIKNPGAGKSVLFWKFEGDASEVFEKLKKELPHIPFTAREKSGYKELFEQYQKRMEEKQGDY